MDLTVHIPDEVVPALEAKASGLPLETFAEQILLEQIHAGDSEPDLSVVAAARRMGAFDKRNDLSLNGKTVRQLRDESHH